MRAALTSLLLLVLSLGARADELCRELPLVTLPMSGAANGLTTMPLTVDGKTTDAVICTSCQWSALSERFLKENGLDIRTGESRFGNWDGSQEHVKSVIRDVRFGNLAVKGYSEFLISHGDDGISSIGMNLLSLLDFEIDNEHNTISFYRHERCSRLTSAWGANAVVIDFNMKQEYVRAIIEINGRNLEVAVESGAPYTMLGVREARAHLGISTSMPGVTPAAPIYFDGSAKPYDSWKYTMPSLVVSGITFQNSPVRIVDIDDYGISLGQHELRQLHMFFNFETKRIFAARVEQAGKVQKPAAE